MNMNLLADVMAEALLAEGPARFDFGDGTTPPAKEQVALAGATLHTVAGTLTANGVEVRVAASAIPPANQTWSECGVFFGTRMVSRFLLPSVEVISGKAINVTWFLPLEV
jgi:hypothetical protein